MPHVYKFGEFQIDTVEETLSRGGERLPINRRTFNVLRLLIERAGRVVSKQEFFDTVWADTFVEDNSLTVAITGIRKLLGDSTKDARFIENLPRRGYRFIADVEIVDASENIRKENDPQSVHVVGDVGSEPPAYAGGSPSTGEPLPKRRTVLWVTAGACFLFLFAALGASYCGLVPSNQIESIAVIPFANTDAETEYLSDGLAETVINDLARLPNLRVISRNSTFKYKNKETDLQAIGQTLNVRAILTGRMVKRGDDLVISAELVDVKSNRQVWGNRYERKSGDTLGLQKEISRDIAEALRSDLSADEPRQLAVRGTENTEAFQLYLKGRYQWNKRVDENTKLAIELFKQAIEKDPTYAMPYIGLANCYLWVHFTNPVTMEERSAMVKSAAGIALEIDPDLGEAYATLAINSHFNDWDWKTADAHYKRSLELNPNFATAHHWYAEFLATAGRFEESFASYKRALELDPLSLAIKSDMGLNYFYARQPNKAIEYLDRLNETDPDYKRTSSFLAVIYEMTGNYEAALTEGDKGYVGLGELEEKRSERTSRLRSAARSFGSEGYWRASLEYELGKKDPITWELIKPYSQLGENDKAFELLEKMFGERSPFLVWMKVSPEFDALRNDPRLDNLMRRVGIPN